jgi:prepilin-type processing-associated H-X9-DG protein
VTPYTDIVFLGSLPAGAARGTPGTEVMPGLNTPGFQSWLAGCNRGAKAPYASNYSTALGESWVHGLVGYTMGTTLLPPNPKSMNCSAGNPGTLDAPGMFNLSSYHPGGANILMCDGSVRFLKDSTSQAVVWSLGSRDRGGIISSDSD